MPLKRKLTNKQLKLAKEMLDNGWSHRALGRYFGVSRQAILPHISEKYRLYVIGCWKRWQAKNKEQIKKIRQRIGKDYYYKKYKEWLLKGNNRKKALKAQKLWRKNHPNYYKEWRKKKLIK